MKKKVIPKKNYFILLLLTAGTLFLCFYLASWYRTIDEYKSKTSIMPTVVSEIDINSFSSILLEKPDVVIYIASSTDKNVKSFEKQFKKIIVNNDLGNDVVYLDIAKEGNENAADVIMSHYLYSSLINKIYTPNLIVFKDSEIQSILYRKENDINKKDVLAFLERNEIIDND